MTGGGHYFGRPQEQSRGVPESAQPPGGVKPVSRKAQVRVKHHPSSAQIDRILSLNQSGMHILLLNILELAVGRAHTHQLEILQASDQPVASALAVAIRISQACAVACPGR